MNDTEKRTRNTMQKLGMGDEVLPYLATINQEAHMKTLKWQFPNPKEIFEYLEQNASWEGLHQRTKDKTIGVKELLQKSQQGKTL